MTSIKIALVVSVLVVAAFLTGLVHAQHGDARRTQSYHFVVTVDGDGVHHLGSWSKVTGLDVSWDLAEYRSDGAANASRRYFPSNSKYGAVKLGRAASGDIDLVFEWLRLIASSGGSPTMEITLIDQTGDAVVSWQLDNISPRNFVVGGSNAQGTDTAIESLVIAHEGFVAACHRC